MENEKIDLLRKKKEQIDAAIAQIDKAQDGLKGDTGEASTKKREALSLKQERLRQLKQSISAEIKKLDSAPSKTAKLEEDIKTLEEQIEKRKEALADKIDSLRERQKSIIGDNDLLKRLLGKERAKFKIRWNREIMQVLDNQEQIDEINAKNDELEKRLKKYEDEFSDAMEEVSSKFQDNPIAQTAGRQAEEEMKEQDNHVADLSKLKEKLSAAETPEEKEKLEQRIIDIEEEGFSDEEKRLTKNIREAQKAIDQIQGKSKEAQQNRDAAQMIIDSYNKQLERIRKKKEEDASK